MTKIVNKEKESEMGRSHLTAMIAARSMREQPAALPPLPAIGKPLKNPRHELYVRCLMACMTCKQAYLACGYSATPASVKGNAHKLKRRPDVAKRIGEIERYNMAAFLRAMHSR